MKGKDKCQILKELRAQIAAANDIEWVTENCTHKGECRGTCPKCEAEVVRLERELERRRALGKTVALTGLAAGMIATGTSCSQGNQWQVREGNALTSEMVSDETSADQTGTEEKSTTDGAQTTTKRVEVEVDGMPLPGDYVDSWYYTDFTLFSSRTFETTGAVYFESVMDSDGNRTSDRTIIQGARFDVVGELNDYWLVSYEGGYYCVWKKSLELLAFEVENDGSDDTGTGLPELAGEPAEIYYYTDFALRDSRMFESTESIYFESVVDSDGDSSPSRTIPEGTRFAVVGETDFYWLVIYEDGYYCVWKTELNECAVEVLAVDDSDNSTAENGD